MLRAAAQGLKEREASGGGGELTCHGASLNLGHEEAFWLKHESLKAGKLALCCCAQALVTSQEAAACMLEPQKKANIDASLEAAIIKPADGVILPALAGGKAEPEGGPCSCLMMPHQRALEKWGLCGQGKGLKGRLSAGAHLATRRIKATQKGSGPHGDPMPAAAGLLSDSTWLLDELASWKASSCQEPLEGAAPPRGAL